MCTSNDFLILNTLVSVLNKATFTLDKLSVKAYSMLWASDATLIGHALLVERISGSKFIAKLY
jgi:hypothetical protein